MTNAIKAATQLAVGVESTRGTAVAAARRIVTKDASIAYEDVSEAHADQMAGLLSRTAIAPTNTRNGSVISITNDLDFQQILLFLMSGIKGGISGVGGAADKTWTFDPAPTADPIPDTFTVEYAESDFAASPNRIMREMAYCFTTALNIQGGIDALPQIVAEMVGRKPSSTTLTSLGLPSNEYIGNLRWALYMDDSWANLGNTQITGQVYGFDWGLQTGLTAEYFLDNRSALDFSAYKYDKRMVDLAVEIAVDPATGGLALDEATDKTSRSKRFVRLEITGAVVGGGVYTVRLDGCYYHADDSLQDRGGDRDGNQIVNLHLESAYDSVSAKDIEVVVINDLASFG